MQVAFALVLLVIIIVAVLTLVGMLAGGIFMIAATARRAKKRKAQGLGTDAGQIFMTILCVLLMILPVGVGGVIAFNRADLAIKRLGYKNFRDKWKNELVLSENVALDDCFRPMLEMAENGDAEGLKKCFPVSMQSRLDSQIEQFLAEYPKGLAMADNMEYRYSSSSGGGGQEQFNGSGSAELDGKMYYIYISAVYQDRNYPDNVGVTQFVIESEEMAALSRGSSWNFYENKQLYCATKSDEDIDVAIINGYPYIRDRHNMISYDDLIKAMKECEKYSEFKERFGEPDVIQRYADRPYDTDQYYEIEPDGDMPRYLDISVYADGRIHKELTNICGRSRDYRKVFFDDDGNLKPDSD